MKRVQDEPEARTPEFKEISATCSTLPAQTMCTGNVALCGIANLATGASHSSRLHTWIPAEMKAYDYVEPKTAYDKLFIK